VRRRATAGEESCGTVSFRGQCSAVHASRLPLFLNSAVTRHVILTATNETVIKGLALPVCYLLRPSAVSAETHTDSHTDMAPVLLPLRSLLADAATQIDGPPKDHPASCGPLGGRPQRVSSRPADKSGPAWAAQLPNNILPSAIMGVVISCCYMY
jgi:hypothetical protein